jgi:membrane-associated protease RseP (regulator of RpoE activity)
VGAIPGFILILLGFGFLIFIHELGHFLAARWAGIRADGFAIGMGPCLVSYRRGIGLAVGSADAKVMRAHGKRPIEMSDAEMKQHGLGETEYSLRALPLGGYVRMLGQEDGYPSAVSADARSFGKASIFRRSVVILAGIAANLALAIVLFLVAFLVGEELLCFEPVRALEERRVLSDGEQRQHRLRIGRGRDFLDWRFALVVVFDSLEHPHLLFVLDQVECDPLAPETAGTPHAVQVVLWVGHATMHDRHVVLDDQGDGGHVDAA